MSMSRRGDVACSAPPTAPSAQRQNEYFVPRDGIDREVITADICRYLGNDALVRPGTYPDPQTGRSIQGYYITAYRNLTSAMIQDLKADSARWEQERRSHSGARYSDSANRHPGSAQYEKSEPSYPSGGSRDSYEVVPRYPGSDAPGYSASQGNQQYEQSTTYESRQPAYTGAPYSQGQPVFSAPGDTRFNGQPSSMAYGSSRASGYPSHTSPTTHNGHNGHNGRNFQEAAQPPYVLGGHYREAERVTDPSSGRVYVSNAPAQDPRYYSQGPSQPSYAQPVDSFGGRGSNGYPVGPAADYASPNPHNASPYQYVPDTPSTYDGSNSTPPPRATPSASSQAQTGNSGPPIAPRRDHRDRDSYSKPDRHGRRPGPPQ